MYLILFLVAIGLVGFYLAQSRAGVRLEEAASSASETPQHWSQRISNWWRNRNGKETAPESFTAWAQGKGSENFPADFTGWLTSLTPAESLAFEQALSEVTPGLGFSLDSLMDDSLKAKPALMQVYVEAVVIYSQAYRRARETAEPAEKAEAKKNPPPSGDGKRPAEKQASRRRGEISEPAEAVPAT